MPVLGKKEEKEIRLPSSDRHPEDPAMVTIITSMTVNDILGEDTKGEDRKKAMLKVMTRIIVKWNFSDAEGKIVPITEDNIAQLEVADLFAIYDEMKLPKEVLTDSKKKEYFLP